MCDDDLVAQFMAVTSSEADAARQYLEACDGHLENAINLYFASGGTSGAPPTSNQVDDDAAVREAIAGFNDQLIDEEAIQTNKLIRESQRAQVRSRKKGVFNQMRDSDLEESNMTKHERRLANLFRPPFDIITDASLDEAREIAQKAKKSVMVNVQDNTEFVCQRVNRDLWRNQQIKDIISKNFIFLQYDIEDPDGEDYKGLYPFEGYPHIGIIDSWTGEQQKVWSRLPSESEFIQDVVEFIATIPDVEGEEEEEKEEKEVAVRNAEEEAKPTPELAQPKPATESNPVLLIKPVDTPEPPNSPETTRIQLRYGDGKRVVRRFMLSDPVSLIYGVAKHILNYDGVITLSSERRDLKPELDKTVEDANLKNSTILVEQD